MRTRRRCMAFLHEMASPPANSCDWDMNSYVRTIRSNSAILRLLTLHARIIASELHWKTVRVSPRASCSWLQALWINCPISRELRRFMAAAYSIVLTVMAGKCVMHRLPFMGKESGERRWLLNLLYGAETWS